MIYFVNEQDKIDLVEIISEWKPDSYSSCKGMGYKARVCEA